MASRVKIYGNPNNVETKRLKREMNVLYVDYDLVDPNKNQRETARLQELSTDPTKYPVVEVLTADDRGCVYLKNPDEPTLRECLYSEGILSQTAYWI